MFQGIFVGGISLPFATTIWGDVTVGPWPSDSVLRVIQLDHKTHRPKNVWTMKYWLVNKDPC